MCPERVPTGTPVAEKQAWEGPVPVSGEGQKQTPRHFVDFSTKSAFLGQMLLIYIARMLVYMEI